MIRYTVTNSESDAREVFSAQPDPRGRALRYAEASRALNPSITFEVWEETQSSARFDTVRHRIG